MNEWINRWENIFEAEFYVAYVDLELTMALSSWFPCLYLMSAEITHMYYHAQTIPLFWRHYFHKRNCYWLVADPGRTIEFIIAHSLLWLEIAPTIPWLRTILCPLHLYPQRSPLLNLRSKHRKLILMTLGSNFMSPKPQGRWGKTYCLSFVYTYGQQTRESKNFQNNNFSICLAFSTLDWGSRRIHLIPVTLYAGHMCGCGLCMYLLKCVFNFPSAKQLRALGIQGPRS